MAYRYSDKLHALIEGARPTPVDITYEQFHSTITRHASERINQIASTLKPRPIRYRHSISGNLVVYTATHGYEGYWFNIRAFLKLCGELGIPYQFSIPLPEPVMQLPVPSWLQADDDDSVAMFKSEAEAALAAFNAEAQQHLALS